MIMRAELLTTMIIADRQQHLNPKIRIAQRVSILTHPLMNDINQLTTKDTVWPGIKHLYLLPFFHHEPLMFDRAR